jgi:hypothetical protein
MGLPKGIFASISLDGGKTWEKPALPAGEGFDWPQIAFTGSAAHVVMNNLSTGGLYHRWIDLDALSSTGEGWSPIVGVPGYAGHQGSFGLATTSSNLYLHARRPDNQLGCITWVQNEDSAGWASPEIVFPDQPSNPTGGNEMLLSGFQVSASGPAGLLGLVLAQKSAGEDTVAEAPPTANLLLKIRSIPVAEVFKETPVEAAEPVEVAELADIPTITPIVPTQTPELNPAASRGEELVSPLVYGGGLAALLIGGVFLVYVVRTRIRLPS